MIKSCYQNVVKFTHFISKEEETNKCHVKHVFWKRFKNSIKQLASLFLVRLQTLFIRRALKGKKVTQTALQRHHHTGALKAFEYLSTWGTPTLEGQFRHLDTWALEALEALETLYLAVSFSICFSTICCKKITKKTLITTHSQPQLKIKCMKFVDHCFEILVSLRTISNAYDTRIAWNWKLVWEGPTCSVVLSNSKLFSKT